MTIKTALILCTGVAIGFFIGIEMDDRQKEKIHDAIKRKIFYAMTGEELPIKQARPKPTSYKTYYNVYDDQKKEEKDND